MNESTPSQQPTSAPSNSPSQQPYSTAHDNIVELEHISKTFGSYKALDDVSINIPRGSIFGLLGPNGAGKTTLIRIINQIFLPDAGTIRFNGRPIQPSDVSNIGYLPEERGLYKKMKVAEQAVYLARLKGLDKATAESRLHQWFDRLDIASWYNRPVEQLSKGMQQKVQFVVSLLHNPPLLILDEPFSGFDPVNADLLRQEILRLKSQGTTIIFSTHNMSSAQALCDHIALINQSHLVLNGPLHHILALHPGENLDSIFIHTVNTANVCEL